MEGASLLAFVTGQDDDRAEHEEQRLKKDVDAAVVLDGSGMWQGRNWRCEHGYASHNRLELDLDHIR
jgi:hypothetical protein